MLNFANSLPCLYDLLDVNATTISRIDATFSARAPNENIAKQVIDHLRNVSNGQTKLLVRIIGNLLYGMKLPDTVL